MRSDIAPRPPQGALLDMAENLHLAQQFIGDLDYTSFRDDRRTFYCGCSMPGDRFRGVAAIAE